MNWKAHRADIIFSILASILLLIFSFSFWFYRDIFNKTNFEKHISNSFAAEDSRDALSSLIIEEGFKNRPILKNILLEQAQPVLAGAMDSPRIQSVFNFFISSIHDSLFSSTPRAIVLEIGGLKGFVENLIFLAEMLSDQEMRDVKIPDQIVIVRQGEIPSILTLGTVLLAIGPFVLLSALGISIWLFVRSKEKIITFKIWGGVLAIFSLLSILLIKWYQPLLLSKFQNSYARTIAEEIFQELSQSLVSQNLLLLVFGILCSIGPTVYLRLFSKKDINKNQLKGK